MMSCSNTLYHEVDRGNALQLAWLPQLLCNRPPKATNEADQVMVKVLRFPAETLGSHRRPLGIHAYGWVSIIGPELRGN